MIGGSNKMLNLTELGEFLSMPMSTLYKNWKKFGIPYTVVVGRPKFRERDIALWLETREAETRRRAG